VTAARTAASASATAARRVPRATEPARPTPRAVPLDPIERIEPEEPIDSTDPADAIEANDPTDATDAKESAEPAEAADSTDPTERQDSTDHPERDDKSDRPIVRTLTAAARRWWPLPHGRPDDEQHHRRSPPQPGNRRTEPELHGGPPDEGAACASDRGLMTRLGPVATVPAVPDADRVIARWRRVPPLAVDAALAAVVALVTVISVVVEDSRDDGARLTGYGVALLGLQLVPLVWRRRAPVVVASLSIAGAIAYGMAELPDPAVLFGPSLASYTVAAHRPREVSVPFAVVVMVAAGVATALARDADAADVAVAYFVGITSWVVGDIVRGQREHAALADQRRADEALKAAADERLRIARDLHDVVAHHISVIAVQAEAAQEVLTTRPDRADAAMAAVADTARAALRELRRVLGVLRSEAELAPQPGLAAVGELVTSVRQGGLAVDLRTTGEERPVDGVVGLTAYRVVQESLTNVLRHAAASRAAVDLAFGDHALVVTVSDDGRGSAGGHGGAPNGSGQGLVGMRERVAVLGGSFDAGPRPEGGFAVRARLPLGE
jgi:signal transduction histidine kinase